MKYLIQVTQEDIDQGCRNSGGRCPIARALIRALSVDFSPHVYVAKTQVNVWNNKKFVVQHRGIPEVAKNFIKQFDAGEKVLPFSFEFEILD